MPLILAPSFTVLTREQVEAHLEDVRLIRLQAAMEYQAGQEQKLEREYDIVHKRLGTAYDQLGKAIVRLDKELAKIEELLGKCEMLYAEAGFAKDRIDLARG